MTATVNSVIHVTFFSLNPSRNILCMSWYKNVQISAFPGNSRLCLNLSRIHNVLQKNPHR